MNASSLRGLECQTALDGPLSLGLGREECVELALAQRLQTGCLGLVRNDVRVGDLRLEVHPGDLQLSLEVVLHGAAGADADPLAVEVRGGLIRRVLLHEELLRFLPIRLGHPQALHPVGVDGPRPVRDVPAPAPVPGSDLGPCRSDEARLHPERLRHGLAGVGVVARDLRCGHLVRGTLRVGEAGRSLHREGLRWIQRVGREHDRAAGLDLGQQILRGVACAGGVRSARRPLRARGAGSSHQPDTQQRQDDPVPPPELHAPRVLSCFMTPAASPCPTT